MEGLLDARDVWQEDEEKMGDMVVDYYTDLFLKSQPIEFNEILQAIQPKVTPHMNQMLNKDFIANEIKVALKQVYPLKALGPSGMPPLFYQHFWPNIGEVVTKSLKLFLIFLIMVCLSLILMRLI